MTTQTEPLLAGQTALVTGASSGIGKATAIALAAAGSAVGVNYRGDRTAADDVVAQIAAAGGRALAVRADVSQEGDVEAMFGALEVAFGPLDILVANAGLQRDAALTEMTLADWQTVMATNLTGQFLCARAAAKRFIGRASPSVSKAAGKIICMSSVHQVIPWAGHIDYAASKGGVMMMMKSLAQELAPKRIRVNAIAPGAIRTRINTAAWDTPAAAGRLLILIPYGRIGEPDDIAKAAVWLASDASDYVVGTTLFVDGGMLLYPGFATGG